MTKHTVTPTVNGIKNENNVHFILFVSLYIVINVVEHGK